MKEQILIVEDDEHITELLTFCLQEEGFSVDHAGSGARALRKIGLKEWDLIFLDYILPDENGLVLLKKFNETDPELPVIFMTGHGSVENAVAAMKAGAFDYLTKPFPIETVIPKARKALEVTSLRRELRLIRSRVKEKYGFDKIVGVGPRMERLLSVVKTVAQSEAETILLLGESGVGKNLIAQAIHYNSRRASRPFMTITCTALSEHLLESELFGHEKGSFTDARHTKKGLCELADGGTIFLDEIGDMPLGLQAKLLGFMENRTFRRVGGTVDFHVDVRIIAATNRDLKQAMLEQKFRQDLYFRLNVMEIAIPPLRDRPEDIPVLALHFVEVFNDRFRKRIKGIQADALEAMKAYQWTGNIREMKNMVERAMILSQGEKLTLADFSHGLRKDEIPPRESLDPTTGQAHIAAGMNIPEQEKKLIIKALELENGNQTRAAKRLGISRNKLIYRMKKFNL